MSWQTRYAVVHDHMSQPILLWSQHDKVRSGREQDGGWRTYTNLSLGSRRSGSQVRRFLDEALMSPNCLNWWLTFPLLSSRDGLCPLKIIILYLTRARERGRERGARKDRERERLCRQRKSAKWLMSLDLKSNMLICFVSVSFEFLSHCFGCELTQMNFPKLSEWWCGCWNATDRDMRITR